MTLALPAIQRKGLQKMPSPSITAPIKEAQSRVAMAGAFGQAANAAAGAFKKYAEKEDKRELRDATLAVHNADMQFQQNYGGKPEYNVMDVDDENFMELTAGLTAEKPVPAHTVYAEWRAKNYKDAMESASRNIRNEETRNAFIASLGSKMETNYASDSIRASKEQTAYATNQGMKEMESALLNKDYEGAEIGVNLSDMPQEAKDKAYKAINTRKQTDYFNEATENRNVPAMKRALDQLIKNDPSTTSQLDTHTQKIFANGLRSAINTEMTAVKSGVQSQLKLVAQDLQQQIDDVWAGNNVNGSLMNENAKKLEATNPKLYREAQRTIAFAPLVNGVLLSTPTEQMAVLQSERANSEGDLDKGYFLDKLEEGIDRGFRERKLDTMAYGRTIGLVAYEPIDYTSRETMIGTLNARVKHAQTLQDKYGTFTGFLEVGELEEFGSRFENAPDKLTFCQTINGALGEYAEPFYEQMKKYGIGETAALAGQVSTWGPQFQKAASNILKGARLRKEDNLVQLKMKEKNSELDSYAAGAFQGMFTGSPKTRSLMVEGFKDVYAVTGNMEEAFNQVTGGVIEFNDYKVQAPVPGMSGWEYKYYLNTLAPEFWDSPDNRAYNFSPEQLRQSILNGTLRQEGLGKGVSRLVAPDGSVVKKPDGVSDYQFKYDPNAATKSLTREGRREQRIKREQEWASAEDGATKRMMYEGDLGI